ncbi:MAG TPA: hypothetical protein VE570_12345 [Thermoleophilaceae bacterium]|jgi:hypothetical protein|nr:hypothetical protein [Thermoleophilaceae bacterium]
MKWLTVRRPDAPSNPGAQVPRWLADDVVESYICWREESAFVQRAYEHWEDADDAEQAQAFAVYQAALDREQQAAHVFRSRSERLGAAVGVAGKHALQALR